MDARVRPLSSAAENTRGRFVLYQCQRNRRVESNHALLFAARLANRLEVPLLVYTRLDCDYPYANDRLHTFALEGLEEFAPAVRALGAGFAFDLARRKGEPSHASELERDAAAIVVDDYPGVQAEFAVAGYAIDSSCVVPARQIEKRMYAAYSLRPRIHRLMPQFLKPVAEVKLAHRFRQPVPAWHTEPRAELAAACEIDRTVPPSVAFRGGRSQAERRLREFLEGRLSRYAREKNEPSAMATSELSPYLHAGTISALEVALAVDAYARQHKLIATEFLEELIVRRELAFNFEWHVRRPDSLDELPEWARLTIAKHAADRRDPCYTLAGFEGAKTHDQLWNAAQSELRLRGKIHGYYRMYWGKKILEWSASAEEALATMIRLNDRYAVDGQDPNSCAGMLWIFGLHDRPWPERPVFGTIRSMVLAGMERKSNVAGYIAGMRDVERTGKEVGI